MVLVLVTDHHPNTYLGTQPSLSRRQARWSEKLQEYDFTWQYRPGKSNVADPVSRSPALLPASAALCQALQLEAVSLDFDWVPRPVQVHAGLALGLELHSARIFSLMHCSDPVSQDSAVLAAVTRARKGGRSAPAAGAKASVGTDNTQTSKPKTPDSASEHSPVPAVFSDPDAVRLSWIPELQEAYKADSTLGDPSDPNIPMHRYMHASNGLWYRDDLIVVPSSPAIKRQIMAELHDSQYAGHGGEARTVQLVRRYFWWPSLDNDVRQFVKGCSLCQRNKASTRAYAGKLQQHDLPTQKWQQVSMDFISGLPVTKHGNSMIMVVVDNLTKMAHFVPCKAALKAEGVATLYVQHIFRLHGWPKTIISDRDGRFLDAFWQNMCSQLGANMIMSTAHHHQTAGQAERMNRVLEETLRHFVSDKMDDWDDLLAAAEFAVNNSYQHSICSTPFYLNYGYHPSVPLDVGVSPNPDVTEFLSGQQGMMHAAGTYHAFAQQRLNADRISAIVKMAQGHLTMARNRQKQYANARRSDVQFQPGQDVMLKTANLNLSHWPSKKLFPLWVGPFRVLKKVSPVSYELELPRHWQIHDVFHVNLLKPYRDNGQGHAPSPFTYLAGQPYEYEVDHILDHWPAKVRIQKGLANKVLKGMQFLVRWRFAGPEADTWEPYSNLKHAPEPLADYGL